MCLCDKFVFDKDILLCAVYTGYLDHSVRLMPPFERCGLMGQVSQQCIVIGQKLHCLYKGFETILGALYHLEEGGCYGYLFIIIHLCIYLFIALVLIWKYVTRLQAYMASQTFFELDS